MTFGICFAVPVDRVEPTNFFSKRITFETITKSLVGKAVLGRRVTGQAYLLSISGRTEVLLDRGERLYNASSFFIEGVEVIGKVIPSASFLVVWLRATIWDKEYSLKGNSTIGLSDLRVMFPLLIEVDTRYVIDFNSWSLKN
jgi:hypothetical protein